MIAVMLLVVLVVTNGAKPVSREFADGHVATIHVFDDSGQLVGPVAMGPVRKTPKQWRETLTEEQFHMLREAGTDSTAQQLDYALWTRGQSPEMKAHPRHRARTTYY